MGTLCFRGVSCPPAGRVPGLPSPVAGLTAPLGGGPRLAGPAGVSLHWVWPPRTGRHRCWPWSQEAREDVSCRAAWSAEAWLPWASLWDRPCSCGSVLGMPVCLRCHAGALTHPEVPQPRVLRPSESLRAPSWGQVRSKCGGHVVVGWRSRRVPCDHHVYRRYHLPAFSTRVKGRLQHTSAGPEPRPLRPLPSPRGDSAGAAELCPASLGDSDSRLVRRLRPPLVLRKASL